jgi:Meiotically up-regulated gene 113
MAELAALKNQILNEVRRLSSENDGKVIGQDKFAKVTGIKKDAWAGRIWIRWSDVLLEAGFEPNLFGGSHEIAFLFQKLQECSNHFGKFPSKNEIKFYKTIDPTMPSHTSYSSRFDVRTLQNEYRKWLVTLQNLSEFDIELLTTLELLPQESPKPTAPAKDGYIYAIKFGDYYKIGRSNDIERRIKQINIALPERGEIIHFIETDDPVGIEKYWHNRLDAYRENGEWFKLPANELAAFKRRKFQ